MNTPAPRKVILYTVLSAFLFVSAIGCAKSDQSSDEVSTVRDIKILEQSSTSGSTAAESSEESTVAESFEESTAAESSEESTAAESSFAESFEESTAAESSSYENTEESTAAESSSAESSEESSDSENNDESYAEITDKSYVRLPEPSHPFEQSIENADGNIVIMLDPGHDDTPCSDRPLTTFGLTSEQDLNLKIGMACYERLLQYNGVTPYMTRFDGSCPNADKQFDDGGHFDCINKRAYLADEKNADIFVSLHCNASGADGLWHDANGICVYVSNYSKYTDESEKLGYIIVKHVTNTVDLGPFGVRTWPDADQGYYDDGSAKDHFRLLSYNVGYGRPAIIIEHGFSDNLHDNAILKDDEQLRLIGQADADAIAEYYGLKLKSDF